MNSFTNFLAHKFSRRVNVSVSPEEFVFESRKLTKTIRTFLYIEPDGDFYKIVSFGADPSNSHKATKVELFKYSEEGFDKFDSLAEFIRHGLKSVTDERALVRPTVICTGSNSLNKIFNGYEESILEKAFEAAGAVFVYKSAMHNQSPESDA